MYFKDTVLRFYEKLSIIFTTNRIQSFLTAFLILSLYTFSESSAQDINNHTNTAANPFIYNCAVIKVPEIISQINDKGFIKPSVTDLNTPSDAYFPILIVFVQFANDPGPEVSWWPKGGPPEYLNQLIATQKKYPVRGNWWDTYSEKNEIISDFWLEQSRGHFHIAGQAVSIILDHDYRYYQGADGYKKINDEIYIKLKNLGTIDWRQYDKWSASESPSLFSIQYKPDGYVDMIYKVHRSHAPNLGFPAGGMAALGESFSQGENYLIDPIHNIYINGNFYYHGSGLTLTPGFGGDETDSTNYFPYSALTKTGAASFSEHEHGHYIFGPGHSNYGKMSGSGAPYGVDECLSPWEEIYLSYMKPRFVSFNRTDYEIKDFSSRNSNDTGEVLQVPANTAFTNEFFLIANRTKVSSYDRIMWGDTAHGDPYRVINPDYGKGVYIYHISGGYYYPCGIDQECADGLFTWNFQGYEHPDWSNEQYIEYYTRGAVSYDNDASMDSKTCADGKSFFNWFGLGQKHSCLYCDGTDKIYTNKTEVWTSREFQGDRWDAWNTGYNEIFSPYSSPSTKDWQNNNTGIFIWIYQSGIGSDAANIKIFKAGLDGISEDSILAITPPSKPVGLNSKLTECVNNIQYPLIMWNHNMEPDMINQTVPPFDMKFYKIYKAKSKYIDAAPSQYSYLTTVNISKDSVPYFIDYSESILCSGGVNIEALRYKISAVDGIGWESVNSDFAAVIVKKNNVYLNNFNNIVPFSYELKQNYPNPFNPLTEITFSLEKDGPVKILVYNITGELVSSLVDEFRQTGIYSVKFDGTSFASGIYFCRMESSGFVQTRKMVLIK